MGAISGQRMYRTHLSFTMRLSLSHTYPNRVYAHSGSLVGERDDPTYGPIECFYRPVGGAIIINGEWGSAAGSIYFRLRGGL